MGIAMIQAQVVRVMPVKTDSIEVQRYYEFLARYQLTGLYQLQFTQPGCFEEIGRAFGKRTAEEWSGADQTAFLKIWPKVENAFRSSYADYLPITAADAFAVLLRRFSLHQLMRMDTWILARVFQANWKELYSLNQTDAMMQPKETCLQVLQTA